MWSEKMRHKLACSCCGVTYGRIYDAVKNGAASLQQVMEVTGAGGACGKCKEFVAQLVREFAGEE